MIDECVQLVHGSNAGEIICIRWVGEDSEWVLFCFIVSLEISEKFTVYLLLYYHHFYINSSQMLEYKLLRLDNDKVVNDEVIHFFLNYHVILFGARRAVPTIIATIIATPDTPATTIKFNNTGVVLCENGIICNMTNEINDEFDNRYRYPAPCDNASN